MDLHIERPELNGQTNEENLAKVDTWIADTSDKLNIALTSLKESTSGTGSTSSTGTTVNKTEYLRNKAVTVYLGDYKAETTEIML